MAYCNFNYKSLNQSASAASLIREAHVKEAMAEQEMHNNAKLKVWFCPLDVNDFEVHSWS